MNQESCNILLASSAENFLPCMVTMLSAILRSGMLCHFYIMQNAWADEMKDSARALAGSYPPHKVSFIDMNDDDFSELRTFKGTHTDSYDKESPAAYYRLLAAQYLPPSVDKILYIDTDACVNKDLSAFYAMDFGGGGVPLIAMTDAVSKRYYENGNQNRAEKYGAFNSGVLLMNLREWRNRGINMDTFRESIRRMGGIYFYDQGLLNYTFQDSVTILPSYKYNFCFYQLGERAAGDSYDWVFSLTPQERKELAFGPYEDEEYDAEAAETIIHYCGYNVPKPWQVIPEISHGQITRMKQIPLLDRTAIVREKAEELYALWWQTAAKLPRKWFEQLLLLSGGKYQELFTNDEKQLNFWYSNVKNFFFDLSLDFMEGRRFERFIESLSGKTAAVLKINDEAGQFFLRAARARDVHVVFESPSATLFDLSPDELAACANADCVVNCSVHGEKTHERDGVKCLAIWDILRGD